MKKSIFTTLTFFVFVNVFLFAQPNSIPLSLRWKTVEDFAAKNLPESALNELDSILLQAQKENNRQEIIKARIYKMRFILEKNPAEAPILIRNFETFANQSVLTDEKAMLFSMTAELYTQYYQSNAFIINRRINVMGYIPDDINAWSKNIYFNKISSLLAESVSNTLILQNTPILKFSLFLENGSETQILQPTLFDWLSQRRINILQQITEAETIKNNLIDNQYFADLSDFIKLIPDTTFSISAENQIIETYQKWLQFRLSKHQVLPLIFTDLNRLRYVFSNADNASSDSLYIAALQRLKDGNETNESVVEVYDQLAEYYLQKYNAISHPVYMRNAFLLCTKGIKLYPNYKRIGLLHNLIKIITQPKLDVQYKNVASPQTNFRFTIHATNHSHLNLKIYRVNASSKDYLNFKFKINNRKKLYPDKIIVDEKIIRLPSDSNFETIDTVFNIQTKNVGIYEFEITELHDTVLSDEAVGNFTVTNLSYIFRSQKPQFQSLYVLQRQSGKPVEKVNIQSYTQKWMGSGYEIQNGSTGKTNGSGFVEFQQPDNNQNYIYIFQKGNDRYFSSESFSYYNEQTEDHGIIKAQLSLFTDRSVYRPGQIVYFKGISFYANKEKQNIDKNKTFELTLYNANNQKISSQIFKTNAFGSFAGAFVLPKSGLTGEFKLQSGNFSQSFWVEEYKRPTFEIIIPKPNTEIRFGEKVSLIGNVKSFAGFNIANAHVKFYIVRVPHPYCWWMHAPDKEIKSGVTITDNDGNFQIEFVPEKSFIVSTDTRGEFYNYRITAEATSTDGETQQTQQVISVGNKSLFIKAQIPNKVEKNTPFRIAISTETLNNKLQKSKIHYDLYRLEKLPDFEQNLNENYEPKRKKNVLSGEFNTIDKTLILNLKSMATGQYQLVLKTLDAWNNAVESSSNFALYDSTDKRPPIKTYTWLLTDKTECAIGDKSVIHFGTSASNVYVLYELMVGNKIIENKWIKFNNEIKKFDIPFKKKYGSGITVSFTFIKNEMYFNKQIQIQLKQIQKSLTPTLSVFRNKILPGSTAEWTITVPEIMRNHEHAELLVDMYDASLDAIRPLQWNFNPVFIPSIMPAPAWISNNFTNSSDYASVNRTFESVPELVVPRINWFGLNLNLGTGTFFIRGLARTASPDKLLDVNKKSIDKPIEKSDNTNNKQDLTASYSSATTSTHTTFEPRTNFNETAFFYPQLQTDSIGNLKLKFSVPESLTRWNLKMLAHTADLFFGQSETQIITQKELMVQLNLPRFVHQSDQLNLSAQVTNLTDKQQLATIKFTLINPTNGNSIQLKDNQIKTIALKPNQTESVSWTITEFSTFDLVACKVEAHAGNFSDSEQKYLPVLPVKILITESQPLTLRNNQTKSYNIENILKNTSKNDLQSMTVEFSTNPAWYAVQALPSISTPLNNNAFDYLSAYYSNSLAGFIVHSNPKIAAVYNQWKYQYSNSLSSNLSKNLNLKNFLSDETPWVREAQDETEQKKQIAILFDSNVQDNQSHQYLEKLFKLQNLDGGFSWYDGMPQSRYLTLEILLKLSQLKNITQKDPFSNQHSALSSALNYVDKAISNDFTELQKNNPNYIHEKCINNLQLLYLHVRSEYQEVTIPVTSKSAVKFFLAQAEKYWTGFSLYGKSQVIQIAFRDGKIQLAKEIVRSLKENALKSDEMGMYWAKNTAGYFWNEHPIEVQSSIIESFVKMGEPSSIIDEMKIWLLKQKQTQRWNSSLSTVDAIYALLLEGNNWLNNTGSVKIKLGNIVVNPSDSEAGTGYFKKTFTAEQVKSLIGKVTVSTDRLNPHSNSIGWGALYWQYYQDINKIDNKSGILQIQKKLFVEKITSKGKSLLPIEQTQLKKGDKVVTRLVISTDRNLEFVALKDTRAACFEPVSQRSGCTWNDGVYYYQTTKDTSTQYFFNLLPKGTYIFEYELWVNTSGIFNDGIATIQCLYAPEFVSHTGGKQISVIPM